MTNLYSSRYVLLEALVIFPLSLSPGVVCGISSTLQVSPFSTSSAYVFGGVCDHWLVAPSLASSGLIFSIAVNFATDQPVTSINRATVRYGSLELVSTASGEFESNLPPLTRQDTPTGFTFSFDNNVVATTGGGANSIQLGDISVIVTHTYSPAGSEGIRIEFGESSLLSLAQGLCGDVRGSLVIGGTANKVTDVSNAAQLEQFTRSWVLPARLQTSTVESCSKYDVIIGVSHDTHITSFLHHLYLFRVGALLLIMLCDVCL